MKLRMTFLVDMIYYGYSSRKSGVGNVALGYWRVARLNEVMPALPRIAAPAMRKNVDSVAERMCIGAMRGGEATRKAIDAHGARRCGGGEWVTVGRLDLSTPRTVEMG